MESKMNGSDKNVGSIEKDIERCEQLTRPEHANWIGLSNQHALEHLIKGYKELKEENKRLFKEIDYTSVYLKARYDEREKWTSKIKEKIKKVRVINNKNTVYIGGRCNGKTFQQAVNERVIEALQELLEGE